MVFAGAEYGFVGAENCFVAGGGMKQSPSCPGRGAASVTLLRRAGTVSNTGVIAGLDPAIHPLRKDSCEDGWMRGSSPRMTREFVTAPALQRTAPQELRAALRPGHGTASRHGDGQATLSKHQAR